MSPTQAAQVAGTSRRSVMRAIEAQELQAFRDNRNHWKITRKAIEEWKLAQWAPSKQVPSIAHLPSTSSQVLPAPAHTDSVPTHLLLTRKDEDGEAELREEREARRLAEVDAAELRGKLAATEAERDRLHGIVQRLTQPQPKRRRWWPF